VNRSLAVRSSTGYFWISPSGNLPSLKSSTIGFVGGFVWPYCDPANAGFVPIPSDSLLAPVFFFLRLRFFFFLSPPSPAFSSSSPSDSSLSSFFSSTPSGATFSCCLAEKLKGILSF
jgi:hypothetical protein